MAQAAPMAGAACGPGELVEPRSPRHGGHTSIGSGWSASAWDSAGPGASAGCPLGSFPAKVCRQMRDEGLGPYGIAVLEF